MEETQESSTTSDDPIVIDDTDTYQAPCSSPAHESAFSPVATCTPGSRFLSMLLIKLLSHSSKHSFAGSNKPVELTVALPFDLSRPIPAVDVYGLCEHEHDAACKQSCDIIEIVIALLFRSAQRAGGRVWSQEPGKHVLHERRSSMLALQRRHYSVRPASDPSLLQTATQ